MSYEAAPVSPGKSLRAVDEITRIRYKAALSDFHYGQENLAMGDRDVSGVSKRVPQCHHQRLLERVSDREGNKTEMMKCCECGAVVHKSSSENVPIRRSW